MPVELKQLFVDVNCPVCGANNAKTLRASSYPPEIGIGELRSMYHASSDNMFMDQVLECRVCRMVYLSPRLDASLIQGGYEEVEDPRFVAQNPQRIRTFKQSLQSILKRTGLDPKGKRLLDIGCAGGACLVAARDLGFEVEGVEPSRWLSAYARSEYGLNVRQGILTPGFCPEKSFDVVSLWDVLEHVPDPHDILTLIRSLLKPDGYLWLNYPNIGSLAAKTLSWRWPFWLSVHLHYYRPSSIRRQVEQAGFEVLYSRPHWQQLQLGYLMERASNLVSPFRLVGKGVDALGLSAVPFTYTMGQTLVICRLARL
jgi:SAM-dependent methyltransferase